MKNNASHSIIEALESRIAPAAVFTFTDVDGDAVTVKTSKGTNAELTAAISSTAAGAGSQLRKIDFSTNAAVFAGTDVIVSVVKNPGGDGLVNIGHIDASDIDGMGTKLDLGKIVIPGDLGQVDAGDTDSNTPAIKSLSVRSIGALGLSTQGGGGQLQSDIRGGVGSITVKGDIRDALLFFSNNGMGTETLTKIGTLTIGGSLIGGASGGTGFITGLASIGSISIGGSMIGGEGTDSGAITTTGDIGSLKVTGDIVGGGGFRSGSVIANGVIRSITLGGSLVGGGGERSGSIDVEGEGATVVKIGRDIVGGDGIESGYLELTGKASALTIGGNIQGGNGESSGYVFADGAGAAKLSGSIAGGGGKDSGQLILSKTIASVTVGGSIFGGGGNSSGNLDMSQVTGAVSVKGSILGSATGGRLALNSAKSMTIGGSIVGGDVSSGNEIGGGRVVQYSNGKLGSLIIGGSIIGGSVGGSANVEFTGSLSLADVGSVLVKGSVVAGEDNSSGTLRNSGSISSQGTIGSLTILGSIIGSSSHRVSISAFGPDSAPAGATQELAIGKISIGGNVTRADVVGGIFRSVPPNGDASIGSVVVKGDWTASSISAGVRDTGGTGFGGADDAIQSGDNDPAIVSRIASIVIGGAIGGSAGAGDTFGFVAQQIGSVKIGGSTVFTGTAATDAVKQIPNITNDLFIREVA